MKPATFTWLDAEAAHFFAVKKRLLYWSIALWVVTAASCLFFSQQAHLRPSALDRAIGAGMDGSFVGAVFNALANYALDSPGVVDRYSAMPGIGSGMIMLTLLVATIASLLTWLYLLLTDRPSAGRTSQEVAAIA